MRKACAWSSIWSRASVWAGRCGLEAESLGCASWWPLGPGYWAREAVAVVVLGIRTAVG